MSKKPCGKRKGPPATTEKSSRGEQNFINMLQKIILHTTNKASNTHLIWKLQTIDVHQWLWIWKQDCEQRRLASFPKTHAHSLTLPTLFHCSITCQEHHEFLVTERKVYLQKVSGWNIVFLQDSHTHFLFIFYYVMPQSYFLLSLNCMKSSHF